MRLHLGFRCKNFVTKLLEISKIYIIKNMKKLIVTILLTFVFTCGCTNSHNSDATFPQKETQQTTNQGISKEKTSLNNEEVISQSKTQEDETEKLHPIDKAERDCIAKVYSTYDISQCSYKAMNMWFKEIDKYLGLLKTITTEEDYTNILKAQENWKKYQESEFVALSIIMNKQGTMFQNVTVGNKTNIVKERALELKELYDTLKYE